MTKTICHLRDHRIDTPNFQPNVTTSVFGGFVTHAILAHQEMPIYAAGADICIQDKANRSDANRVFIIHSLQDASECWSAAFQNGLLGHAVLASTQGVYDRPQGWPVNRCHPCEWKPEQFASPPPRLAKWLNQIQTVGIGEIDWELLRHDRNEPLLAFRLLCEAKQKCGRNPSVSLTGITIHAPQTLADWLDPFAPVGTSEAQRIASVVGKIGDGEIRAKAEAVLDVVSDAEKLGSAIEAFLKASAAPVAKG